MSIFDMVLLHDVETTMYKHQDRGISGDADIDIKDREGSSFCLPQHLVMSGCKWLKGEGLNFQTDIRNATQDFFDNSTLVVGFNIKFDLNWDRRIGVDISKIVIWDCQLAEFILGHQKVKYPSMNATCEKYGIAQKEDIIALEYWDKGKDTDEVPVPILDEYLDGDLNRTGAIFIEQLFQFKGIRL